MKLMNQNFFKSKTLHESYKLEHLSVGGGEVLGVKIVDLSEV